MSEYWKSTATYWCKHCSCYVRDTKLERQNHEATAKHQGALKRFLRELHRGHDRDERDKERAKREISRLNGVVAGASTGSSKPALAGATPPTPSAVAPSAPTESQLKRQREQLADLGVAVPSNVRQEMAMPGEWTVTATKIIDNHPQDHGDGGKSAIRATGVRKREETEEEKAEEDAIRGLFKKPRQWGRDSRTAPEEEDKVLDALLDGSILSKPAANTLKGDRSQMAGESSSSVPDIKQEPDDSPSGLPSDPGQSLKAEAEEGDGNTPTVAFKKRRPKAMRQK